jgi:hypothetical protein
MSNTLSADGYLEFGCFGHSDEYPKSTEQVAVEFRSRGFNATVPALNYMIRQGKVQPDREGRKTNGRRSISKLQFASAVRKAPTTSRDRPSCISASMLINSTAHSLRPGTGAATNSVIASHRSNRN